MPFLYTKTTTNMDLTFILNNPGLFLFSVGFIWFLMVWCFVFLLMLNEFVIKSSSIFLCLLYFFKETIMIDFTKTILNLSERNTFSLVPLFAACFKSNRGSLLNLYVSYLQVVEEWNLAVKFQHRGVSGGGAWVHTNSIIICMLKFRFDFFFFN